MVQYFSLQALDIRLLPLYITVFCHEGCKREMCQVGYVLCQKVQTFITPREISSGTLSREKFAKLYARDQLNQLADQLADQLAVNDGVRARATRFGNVVVRWVSISSAFNAAGCEPCLAAIEFGKDTHLSAKLLMQEQQVIAS